jgi:hypothetical protein
MIVKRVKVARPAPWPALPPHREDGEDGEDGEDQRARRVRIVTSAG